LGPQVIHLRRLHLFQDLAQGGAIGEIPIVEKQPGVGIVGIHIDVVDAVGIEGAGAAENAVDFIVFLQQQLGQVRAILAGDAGN
jgi:hypothetical protein